MKYKAFLFDLNGTMINDMDYHVRAWYRILNELGANISLEQTKLECYGKNGEVLERVFPGRFTEKEKDGMSIAKERQYQEEFRPHLKLIPGLDKLLQFTKDKGIKMAIGSAAILFNIDFVIDGLQIRHYFDAIVSADDVAHSKPDPETYTKCANQLRIDPRDCLVFEDAPKGVESAQNAGMDCVVITSFHPAGDFNNYGNVIRIIEDYDNFVLQ
jgi:HAD superfamily hydrolase (TIGR01509 family)